MNRLKLIFPLVLAIAIYGPCLDNSSWGARIFDVFLRIGLSLYMISWFVDNIMERVKEEIEKSKKAKLK